MKYQVGDIIEFETDKGHVNGIEVADRLIVMEIREGATYPYKLKDLKSRRTGRCCGWKQKYIEENTSLIEGDD